MTDRKENNCKT